MFNWFKPKSEPANYPVQVDIHSHLLPGLDDGVASLGESLEIIRSFQAMGIKKIVTTPHIMSDHYPNTPLQVNNALTQVQEALEKEGIGVELEAAAEYFLDEEFLRKIKDKETLLTFGDGYLLFETSFLNQPVFLKEVVFQMNLNGYKPVLAHPERYLYLQSNLSLIEELGDMNVHFQLNLLSLSGYYSKSVKKVSKILIEQGKIDFIGSDCHNILQFNSLKRSINTRFSEKLAKLNLLNDQLL